MYKLKYFFLQKLKQERKQFCNYKNLTIRQLVVLKSDLEPLSFAIEHIECDNVEMIVI